MKLIAEMSPPELAAYIQTHLDDEHIEVVLSGGAAVSFYTRNVYLSNDIDLINAAFAPRRSIAEVMLSLGFQERGRHFTHPLTPLLVEFPAGPLAVGSEPVRDIRRDSLETGILKIISPTDSVKDRLLAHLHWGDQQSWAQAVLIARTQDVNMDELERWARVEGFVDSLEAFRRAIDQQNPP